jgi:hypothetical protein
MIYPMNNHLLIHQLILISRIISIKDIKYSSNKANIIKLLIKIFKRITANRSTKKVKKVSKYIQKNNQIQNLVKLNLFGYKTLLKFLFILQINVL